MFFLATSRMDLTISKITYYSNYNARHVNDKTNAYSMSPFHYIKALHHMLQNNVSNKVIQHVAETSMKSNKLLISTSYLLPVCKRYVQRKHCLVTCYKNVHTCRTCVEIVSLLCSRLGHQSVRQHVR